MTEKIKEQILAVRDTGLTNMFDVNAVSASQMTWASSSWSCIWSRTAANMRISSSPARHKLHSYMWYDRAKDCAIYSG